MMEVNLKRKIEGKHSKEETFEKTEYIIINDNGIEYKISMTHDNKLCIVKDNGTTTEKHEIW
jgi:hypothetical protein